MTPFDLIILTVVVGFASAYLDRRWQARRARKRLAREEAKARAKAKKEAASRPLSWWQKRVKQKAEEKPKKKSARETAKKDKLQNTVESEPAGGAVDIQAPSAQAISEPSAADPAEEDGEGEEEGEEEESGVFTTWVAITIALVTLVGAWVGWGIGTVYGEASGEQSAGLSAALNVESTLTNSSVSLYKEYRVFTEYTRYQVLAELQARAEEGGDASALSARKTDEADLAAVQLPFFLTRYLTRNGDYDRSRQLGETWAESSQRMDLDPAPHFAVADVWQQKTQVLVGLFIILSFSLLFLTLAEALDRKRQILRYSMAILGTLLLILTVVAKFWIERG